jgi:hypothetical protein
VIAAALLVVCGAACEPLPQPLPRVVAASPSGTVPARDLRVEFSASDPLVPADVLKGKVALCRAEDLRDVKRLVEDGEPLPPEQVIEVHASLEDGGRRVVLVPVTALVPGFSYAAVLGHGVRSADGRLVLDAEGRPRSVVVEFTVSTALDARVRAELVKVLADADAPEAGGEYVEVANLAPEPLDLAGFRLAKRGPTGSFTRCTITRRSGLAIPAQALGVIVGGAYDGRYELPSSAVVYDCGGSAVAGGLANDRAPALLLEAPDGATVSSLGVAAPAPRCDGGALIRSDPAGPDALENLTCSERLTPGSTDAVPR